LEEIADRTRPSEDTEARDASMTWGCRSANRLRLDLSQRTRTDAPRRRCIAMDIRPSAACGGLCNGRAGSTSARGFDVFALGPTDQRARARIHDSPRSPRPFLVRPDAAGLPRGVVRMGDRHLRRRVDLAPDARKLNVGARSCRRNLIHTVRGMLSLGTTPYPQEESASSVMDRTMASRQLRCTNALHQPLAGTEWPE